jgi:hypothetical protein
MHVLEKMLEIHSSIDWLLTCSFIVAYMMANLIPGAATNAANGLLASIQNIFLNAATSAINSTGVLTSKNFAQNSGLF